MCLGSKCHVHASRYRRSEILGFHSSLCALQVFWNVTPYGLVNGYGRQHLAFLGRPTGGSSCMNKWTEIQVNVKQHSSVWVTRKVAHIQGEDE